jgi:hypothetical protein
MANYAPPAAGHHRRSSEESAAAAYPSNDAQPGNNSPDDNSIGVEDGSDDNHSSYDSTHMATSKPRATDRSQKPSNKERNYHRDDDGADSDRRARAETAKNPRAADRSRATNSRQQPLAGRNIRASTNPPMPGTLLFLSEEAKGDDALDSMEAAEHITHWTAILEKGDLAFECALNKEQRRITRGPVVFAFIENDSSHVQLAHGFEEIALDNTSNGTAETVGFFIGDRVTVTINDVVQQTDPPFWTVPHFATFTSMFCGKPATEAACSQAALGQALLPGDPKARMIDVPKLFPIPRIWWSYFLTRT